MSIERELIREAYFKLLNYVPENDELVQEMAEYLDKPETNIELEINTVLVSVEEAVRNGCAPYDVEDAFEKYEKALTKSLTGK